jgi:hypothetical protein
MSHRNVEKVIGRLATDEGFRRRFLADAAATLVELVRQGDELTPVEIRALAAIEPELIELLARGIDGRLQKVELETE